MKSVLVFIVGVLVGVVLTVVVFLFVASKVSPDDGITIFEKEGKCISRNSFVVMQVLDSGNVLARELERGDFDMTTNLIVMFLSDKEKSYYDGQIIKMPVGKCAKQIGVFKYTSNMGTIKTVPIVAIRNK